MVNGSMLSPVDFLHALTNHDRKPVSVRDAHDLHIGQISTNQSLEMQASCMDGTGFADLCSVKKDNSPHKFEDTSFDARCA